MAVVVVPLLLTAVVHSPLVGGSEAAVPGKARFAGPRLPAGCWPRSGGRPVARAPA